MKPALLLGILGGALALYAAHVSVNVGWGRWVEDARQIFGGETRQLTVGFLPVTCHLTCPVVDWTTRHSESGALYQSKRYTEFPTMCEDLLEGSLGAAFLNAPMAIQMALKGYPVKLVSLGHRDGSAIVVPSGSPFQQFTDLKGKRILIPSKASNQQLWFGRLCKQSGLALTDFDLVVCPPPEMPAMLETGQCDAYIVGEPWCAKAELAGIGRVLLQVKDSWPNFISCGLVVRQDLIDHQRGLVQEIVDGIHGSGLWLEQGVGNRASAAEVAGKYYFNQDPKLLEFVLSKPVDRVRYDHLTPLQGDFEEIMALAVEVGMFEKTLPFESFVDTSFSLDASKVALPMPPDDGQGLSSGTLLLAPKPGGKPVK
ncbi:MAG: ABC transporter substrate-binding protein [Planctomycetes bacterium]|jgi:NitT/TauT family transport system substrate-binding protein|nr:ABC transporter substrate-binding protein [Planctomycetota bacterium]